MSGIVPIFVSEMGTYGQLRPLLKNMVVLSFGLGGYNFSERALII